MVRSHVGSATPPSVMVLFLSAPPVCCFFLFSVQVLLFQVTLFKENAQWRKVSGTELTRRQTALFCPPFAVSSCFLVKSSSFLLIQVTLFKENLEWRKVLGRGLTRRQTALFCFFFQRRLLLFVPVFCSSPPLFFCFKSPCLKWRKFSGTGLTRRQTALFCFVSTACLLVKPHRSVVGCASALGHIHVM